MLNKKRIAIFVGFLCCLFFMTTFAGGTTQNTAIATRQVTFLDGYNNSTVSEQTIEVGTDAEVPEDPKHDNFVFAGWYLYDDQDVRVTDFTNILENLTVIAKYAGDLNGNGIADDNETRYTVTFVDSFDNRVLGTDTVLPGMSATAPVVPAHDGRTFVGWNVDYTNVNGNITTNTVYNLNQNVQDETVFHNVTFIDSETDEVIAVVRVADGLTAQAPVPAVHANRVFDYWDGNYNNVTSDRTITAVYTDDLNNDGIKDYLEQHYTVEFIINGQHGQFANDAILTYENIVAGLTFDQIGIVLPSTVLENEHYEALWSEVRNGTLVPWDTTNIGATVVNGNLVYAVSFVPDVDDNSDGIADADQAKSKLTISYVSINEETQAEYVIEQIEVENVLEKIEYSIPVKTFDHYTEKVGNPTSIVMPNHDMEVKIYYHVKGDDNDKNGRDDSEEYFDLNVQYISRGTSGEHLLDTLTKTNVKTGTVVNIAKDFPGYLVDADQPSEVTITNKDETVVIYYHVDGDDKDNNGRNDSEEYFDLTVRYVSKGTDGEYLLGSFAQTDVKTGTTVNIAKDFTGYLVDEGQLSEVTITDKDENITVYYHVDGDDSDNNGRNDSEEYFDLNVQYISKGTDGEYLLGSFAQTDVKTGTTVSIAKDFPGYLVNDGQPSEVTITDKDENITVYYHVDGDDKDNNGRNDSEEYFDLTVQYISKGTNGEYILGSFAQTDVKTGTTVSIAKDFPGYLVDEGQLSEVTITNKDESIVVYYHVDGDDSDNNGRNDAEEYFQLTIHYVSQGTNGSYDLGTVVEPKVKMGTSYNLVKDFDGYQINDEQDEFFTMPNHDAETTVYYHVDGDDSDNNGRNDDEEYFDLMVRYISEGTNGEYLLGSFVQTNVKTGTTVSIAKDFPGYLVNDGQLSEVTITDKDESIVVYYHVDGDDKDNNGRNDAEEYFDLNVQYISKGKNGEYILESFAQTDVKTGTTVSIAKDFPGYLVDEGQLSEVTITDKDENITVYYHVDGDDSDNNGRNDAEEYFQLTIHYVSQGTNGSYDLGTVVEPKVKMGTSYNLVKDFDGYQINDDQDEFFTMPNHDAETTVYYHVDGDDSDNNGRNDAEEYFALTIHYVSQGTNGSYDLGTVVEPKVKIGTNYSLVKDFDGYRINDDQDEIFTMPNHDAETTVYYHVDGNDENGSGRRDDEEMVSVTVRYLNAYGKEIEANTQLSVLAGTTPTINAKDIVNYTPVQSSVSPLIPFGETYTVDMEYTANITGIVVKEEEGKSLQFSVGADESELRSRIHVYLQDADGVLREEVTDYTTDFDSYKSTSREHQLRIDYNYNGTHFSDTSLVYILVAGEVSENGFDLTYTEGARTYKVNRYGTGTIIGGTKDSDPVDYEFLELTKNYFGNVEMVSATAHYEGNKEAKLEISNRVRYYMYGVFTGNYYNSVFIVKRSDNKDIVKDGESKLETIELTYRKDGSLYIMSFRYENNAFHVESTQKVD